MKKDKETPGEKRERLRQEELKRNPAGSIHGAGLQDMIGDIGWKGAGILILLIILFSIIYLAFFS
ncbi:DUF6366 family protein [Ureibacillus chungkukjangi]|uniref:Phage capsid protein n=1 Tax=Ureibacillus chungkukjangi TaxID=1202712 RepID=A0A318TNF3_9BACL|nr:DUF6366 family protein [Ureibacillus chungkukjangi]PYF06134.1 hypothetical protein BJ095_11295 [Ureibacillus chungkukjangi]